MKIAIFICILVAMFAIVSCVQDNTIIVEDFSYPSIDQDYPLLSISDLNAEDHLSEDFIVEGNVVKVFTCPSCPKGKLL